MTWQDRIKQLEFDVGMLQDRVDQIERLERILKGKITSDQAAENLIENLNKAGCKAEDLFGKTPEQDQRPTEQMGNDWIMYNSGLTKEQIKNLSNDIVKLTKTSDDITERILANIRKRITRGS